ncbi:vesicle-associated membrane protein 727 [Tanacetum coccineum]
MSNLPLARRTLGCLTTFVAYIVANLEMNQKGLIYSFVAKGSVVLAEHTAYSGNVSTIAVQCLQKLPNTSSKYTYSCDGYTFNFLLDIGFVFLVVADESLGRSVPFVFLERVKDDFKQRYGGSIASDHPLGDESDDDLFEDRPILKEHMDYCLNHPGEMSKLSKLKAQITEVKGIMMDNIDKVLDRGEKIELLVDKTENLQFQVQFRPIYSWMGQQLSNTGKTTKKENVVTKSANEANNRRINTNFPHHSVANGLWWFYMLKVSSSLYNAFSTSDLVQKARLQTLRSELETLKIKPHESTSEFAGKLSSTQAKFKSLGGTLKDKVLVRKLLNSVPKKFLPIVASIEQYQKIDTMQFEEAVGRITAFEERLKSQDEPEYNYQNKLLLTSSNNQGGGRGHGRNFTKNKNSYGKGTSRGSIDKSKLRCYECGEHGYFAKEFTKCKYNKTKQEESHLIYDTDNEPTLL